jgi:hypothetical protein
MKVTIGKNTLGGGKKMTTRLNNYNRSTHDNSFVMRTTMAPGVLVPTMTELLLPGDTYPIQTRCHTLTHPTIGPLFGSFKQQNDFFFCPIRLYNAMLHNNTLNIGLDMKKVKFPAIRIDTSKWDLNKKMIGSNNTLSRQVHPSSLLSYLGYRSLNKDENSTTYEWNITKVLMYYDIFKNYYANKQEETFYTIGGAKTLTSSNISTTPNSYFLGIIGTADTNGMYRIEQIIPNPTTQTIVIQGNSPIIAFRDLENYDLNNTYLNGTIVLTPAGENRTINLNMKPIKQLIGEGVLEDVSNLIIPISGKPLLRVYRFKALDGETATKSINITNKVNAYTISGNYNKFELSSIDDMRESILSTGRQQYISDDAFILKLFESVVDIYDTSNSPTKVPNSAYPMVGLALKTYQSDINTNWVNTEWIDGESGINAITAIDTSGGSFTLDTLNLAKKVYTMLNRIAISDGSYNAWIQTVYTSGGLNHIETPLYLGGSSLEIDFQEVINNSGTENQPLGSMAGRGVATNHKGGNVIFKADEPGYIFCITSITPRVDYFQGNDWDLYLESLDDLHKPQLDGIGFQDRLYRHLNSSCIKTNLNTSIGKQPAWIQYMTNVNKTYGNFALVENEGWMCLNRIFEDIDSYTTYIQPHLYNNIFADTELTAQNFWVQIAFNYKPRRVMSAKIIPNI